MRTRTIVIGLVSVAILTFLALVIIPRLLDQIEWPTQAWLTSTPEEQGFDSAKLAQGLQAMQEKISISIVC